MSEVAAGEAFCTEIDRTRDPFRLAIRGQQGLDQLLTAAIAETLGGAHTVELSSLRFPTRVDLAMALGAFPAAFGPALVEVNRVRNRFAHEPSAEFAGPEAQRLLGTLPDEAALQVRQQIDDVSAEAPRTLAYVILVLFHLLQLSIAEHRDSRVVVDLAMGYVHKREADAPIPLTPETEEAIHKSREERAAEGRL